jgi:methylation protein EvaC
MIKCRVCKTDNLEILFDNGMMPVSGYLVNSLEDAFNVEKYQNLLVYCPKCALVQQGTDDFYNTLIRKVYSNYQPTYSMSGKVREYMTSFIDDAIKLSGVKSGIAIEVGSNDGSMLSILRSRGLRPAGIDPSAIESYSDDELILIRDYFSTQMASSFVNEHGSVKLLFTRHTLEHTFDPADFINAICLILDNDGIAVVEIPYLPMQLSANQYAGFTFQHISFFTLRCLKQICESCELNLFDIKISKMDGGSIIAYLKKNKKVTASRALIGLDELEKNRKINDLSVLKDKFSAIRESMNLVKCHMQELKKQRYNIVGYGAGSKGQAILNMLALNSEIIPFVVDDTPGAKNMYITGVGAKIINNTDVRFSDADYVLVTAPTHTDEIVSKEYKKNPHIVFLRTSPEFGYVSNM